MHHTTSSVSSNAVPGAGSSNVGCTPAKSWHLRAGSVKAVSVDAVVLPTVSLAEESVVVVGIGWAVDWPSIFVVLGSGNACCSVGLVGAQHASQSDRVLWAGGQDCDGGSISGVRGHR